MILRGLFAVSFLVLAGAKERIVISKVGSIKGEVQTVQIGLETADITTFLGIPYAEPPVGDRRFAKPVRKANFEETFPALEFGASCQQNTWLYKPEQMDEDCLFINVYTPDTTGKDEKVPVMLWIHGGAFVLEDGKIFGGDKLTAYGKVVVVTFNYRLGPLGFLNTGDGAVDTNNGLRDQHLAIKWVKENIESFGGDASKITIFGESAGGTSVSYQAIYPENEGLFQRAIIESGTANAFWSVTPDPLSNAKLLAQQLNCPIDTIAEMVQCMRAFKNATHIAVVSYLDGLDHYWNPSWDNDFAPKERLELLNQPKENTNLIPFSNIDVMIGTNDYEGHILLLTSLKDLHEAQLNTTDVAEIKKINEQIISFIMQQSYGKDMAMEVLDAVLFMYSNYEKPNDRNLHIRQPVDFMTDIGFFIPSSLTTESHAFYRSNSVKTFQYEFTARHIFQYAAPWITGALHADEVLYVFGFTKDLSFFANFTTEQMAELWPYSCVVMDYWSNFAKTGNPNLPRKPEVEWKAYLATTKSYMHMATSDLSNKEHLNAMRVHFWTQYIPSLIRKLSGHPYSQA